ncbi:MAG: hypothetical protein ACREBU_17005, partial [Nitrososphaera sp.]
GQTSRCITTYFSLGRPAMTNPSRSNSDIELFDTKSLTVKSKYFISVLASVARKQEGFYEN